MKIDVFPHIFPPRYHDRMLRLAGAGQYMQKRTRGIPVLVDLDLRLRIMDRHEGYFGAHPAMECGLAFFGADRVLFGTDMPFDPEKGPGFIRETMAAVERMRATPEEKAKIYSGNARRLLRLRLPTGPEMSGRGPRRPPPGPPPGRGAAAKAAARSGTPRPPGEEPTGNGETDGGGRRRPYRSAAIS